MEILAAFDLTGSFRDAAELADCSHHTVARYVAAREAGGRLDTAAARPQLIDEFLPKVEEWVSHSHGKVRADKAHEKLLALGYCGSERTTRRAVHEAKAAFNLGRTRVHRPWVTEPGMWLQYDFGDGPVIAGRKTVLFCAWLAWSRFRVVLALRDRTAPSVFAALDVMLRRLGGAPTYVLTDNEKTVTVDHIAVDGSPIDVAFAPDGRRAYVTSGSGAVAVIDTATNTVAATVPVGGGPTGVAITPDGRRAYVANFGSKAVNVIDTTVEKPAITSADHTTFTVGQAATFTVTATGSPPPTFALSNAPGWLAIDSTTGVISGTPPAGSAGSYPLTVTATNIAGSAGQSFTVTVLAPLAISGTLPEGTLGHTYRAALTATGGTPPYTWSITSGALPPGLALSETGVVTGRPTKAGSFTVTVGLTDGADTTTTKTTTIAISAPAATTTTAPDTTAPDTTAPDTTAPDTTVTPTKPKPRSALPHTGAANHLIALTGLGLLALGSLVLAGTRRFRPAGAHLQPPADAPRHGRHRR